MLSLGAKANSLLHRSALRRAAVSADACWVLLGRASPLPSIGNGFSMHDVDAVAAAAAGGRDLASARHARRTPGARQERMTEELLQERPGVRRARRTETAIKILKLHRRMLKLRMRPRRMPACFPVIGHANSVRFRVARSVFRHLAKKQQNRPVRA